MTWSLKLRSLNHMEIFEMNLKKTPESILGTACKQWKGFKKNPINRELLNTITTKNGLSRTHTQSVQIWTPKADTEGKNGRDLGRKHSWLQYPRLVRYIGATITWNQYSWGPKRTFCALSFRIWPPTCWQAYKTQEK